MCVYNWLRYICLNVFSVYVGLRAFQVHAADKPAASVTAAASPEAGVKNHNQLAAGGALGAFRGGSLPNVSAPECNAPIIKVLCTRCFYLSLLRLLLCSAHALALAPPPNAPNSQ